MSTRPTVIVTYCRRDAATLDRLKIHLTPLVNQKKIRLWVDEADIPGGADWEREIATAISEASIAILLVSADYLASEVVRTRELPPILARAHKKELTVLSVFVSYSDVSSLAIAFEDTDEHDPAKTVGHAVTLDKFQGYGTPRRPLSEMPEPERERIFVALGRRVRELAGGTGGPRGDPEPPRVVATDPHPVVARRRRRGRKWWPWIAGAGAVAALLLWAGSAAYCPREVRCETAILTPEAGATVGASGTVKGSARLPPDGHLWILSHPPVPGNQWWPQEPASVRNDDGTWSAVVYFGNEDDVGAEFEIAAVVVTPGTNASFEQWLKRGRERDDYPSLPFPIGTERVPGCADARRIVKKVSH